MKESDVLRESEIILKHLCDIIKNEQQALVSVDEETLSEIVSQKNSLLDSLDKYQSHLSLILKQDKGAKTKKIRELLTQCQTVNLQNRQVGHIGLTAVNKSLDALQSAMHISAVKTYEPSGMKTTGSRKRDLGVV